MNKKGWWPFGGRKKWDQSNNLKPEEIARLEAAWKREERFIAEIQTLKEQRGIKISELQIFKYHPFDDAYYNSISSFIEEAVLGSGKKVLSATVFGQALSKVKTFQVHYTRNLSGGRKEREVLHVMPIAYYNPKSKDIINNATWEFFYVIKDSVGKYALAGRGEYLEKASAIAAFYRTGGYA